MPAVLARPRKNEGKGTSDTKSVVHAVLAYAPALYGKQVRDPDLLGTSLAACVLATGPVGRKPQSSAVHVPCVAETERQNGLLAARLYCLGIMASCHLHSQHNAFQRLASVLDTTGKWERKAGRCFCHLRRSIIRLRYRPAAPARCVLARHQPPRTRLLRSRLGLAFAVNSLPKAPSMPR